MPSAPAPLRLYPTEAAARKAGLTLADLHGERLSTVLYALLPEAEKKPTYLLSSSIRLTVSEKRWVEEHQATGHQVGQLPSWAEFRATSDEHGPAEEASSAGMNGLTSGEYRGIFEKSRRPPGRLFRWWP